MTKMVKTYTAFHQNGLKTIALGAAHTYIAYVREHPPPGGLIKLIR